MRQSFFLFNIWTFSLLISFAFAEEQQCIDDDTCPPPEVPCGVYMAPSTVGDANLGIYTGIDLEPSEVINFPEIVVPLMFREWGDHGDNPDGSLWDRYIWDAAVVNVEPWKDARIKDDKNAAFIPGVGCTINSRLDLLNIDTCHGSKYDTAGLHRYRDVGAGAFSPYHSSPTSAKLPIKAGSELLGEYGSEWIPDIPGAVLTFTKNMDEADEFLDDYHEWVSSKPLPDNVAQGLWNLTSTFPTSQPIFPNLPKTRPWNQVSDKVQELKVKKREELDDDTILTKELDFEKQNELSTVRYFMRQDLIRPLEWLKQHGKCQDHLKPGTSTIPQAGRGAFASRNLPKGTVVGYAPLIHMADNRELWDITYKEGGKRKYINQDLILNYSFGHRHSTLLLTPYGAMVNFINHSKEKANVKIAWPSEELVAHKPEWLQKDLNFLKHSVDKIGLSFDYVALRDIEEGEEIFMDYGDEWQAAWDEHVRNWKPLGDSNYVHATEWEGPLLTPDEPPYPSNLVTLCHDTYSRVISESGDAFWTPRVRESTIRIHCKVLERFKNENDKYMYTVEYQYDDGSTVVVQRVPPEGIELTDKAKSADWHMEGSFRHEIMIPDEMFPESWKNRK